MCVNGDFHRYVLDSNVPETPELTDVIAVEAFSTRAMEYEQIICVTLQY